MSEAQLLVLRHGKDRCEIYPSLGGSIGRWAVGNQEMFRVASVAAIDAHDPFGMATFPLVPYSNRIGYAQFEWAGKTVTLRPNFAPEPHAIHGIGWKRAWTVAARSDATATLRLSHGVDDDWPWPFEAEQQIALADGVLKLTLRATNRADTSVPLAFGHHPYFDQLGATLSFAADTVWLSGQDALPTEPIAPHGQFDFGNGSRVAGRNIDHCYSGIRESAVISWIDRALSVEIGSSPQLSAAVVFVPQGGDAFCFEPVPHINNALNLPGKSAAIPILAPGQTTETVLTFKAFAK